MILTTSSIVSTSSAGIMGILIWEYWSILENDGAFLGISETQQLQKTTLSQYFQVVSRIQIMKFTDFRGWVLERSTF